MRGKRLPGADNTALRRRIVRDENDIIPRVLRDLEPPGLDDALAIQADHRATPAPQPPRHGAQPASGAQMHIGAQLLLPTDHGAASWLSTSWTVPDLTGPLPDVPGQWARPSPDAARGRGHTIHSASPAPQPPLNVVATTAATSWAGSKRSWASMDVREPAGEDPTCWSDKQGCPDLRAPAATPHLPFMERHMIYKAPTPMNECHQFDADPDAVPSFLHTSVARAESPSLPADFARFAFAPSEDSFARSISTDFTRVTSAEDRAFARELSISAEDKQPGFLVHLHGRQVRRDGRSGSFTWNEARWEDR